MGVQIGTQAFEEIYRKMQKDRTLLRNPDAKYAIHNKEGQTSLYSSTVAPNKHQVLHYLGLSTLS